MRLFPHESRSLQLILKTAGELRAEAQHLRDIADSVSDPELTAEVRELIEELEARARELENGP